MACRYREECMLQRSTKTHKKNTEWENPKSKKLSNEPVPYFPVSIQFIYSELAPKQLSANELICVLGVSLAEAWPADEIIDGFAPNSVYQSGMYGRSTSWKTIFPHEFCPMSWVGPGTPTRCGTDDGIHSIDSSRSRAFLPWHMWTLINLRTFHFRIRMFGWLSGPAPNISFGIEIVIFAWKQHSLLYYRL